MRNDIVPTQRGSITDVPGISVGHAQDQAAGTGCTVVLCERGAVAAVDVRGAAPGTRETDALAPGNLVEQVHGVLLTGGSTFGLDAACGVVRFLEERGIGFDTVSARVPIVPAAVIYDLSVGNSAVRPDATMGYQACLNASKSHVEEGLIGAGSGATVGKILGHRFASAGGIGSLSTTLGSGCRVGVLVVVNALGDIVDPKSGLVLAGAKKPDGSEWLDTSSAISKMSVTAVSPIENTTLAVVATDAALTRVQALRVATMAHDGLARSIRPVHTMFDGDTVFVLSTGRASGDVTALGSVAADLLADAIARVGRNSAALG